MIEEPIDSQDLLTAMTSTLSGWMNHHAVAVIIILACGLIAQQFLRFSCRKIKDTINSQTEGTVHDRANRAKTLTDVFSTTVSAIIWSIVVLLVLDTLGINIGPLLAGAGIIGLALSFGANELVKDLISGFFFLYENQFNVGDYLKIKDHEGVVREMNLRTVRLKGAAGERIIIRNSQIDVVTRWNHPSDVPKKKPDAK